MLVLLSILMVIAGVGLLYWGGEVLVDSSISMARHFGVSALVIGLTVVAFATSAPELAAAITANLRGSPDIAVGNVVGSNIANVCLILGLTSVFFTLPANRRFIRRELAFMIVATIVVYPVMLRELVINRVEGFFLFVALVWFLRTLLTDPGHQVAQVDEEGPSGVVVPLWHSGLGVTWGLVLLIVGAQLLVLGASDIARSFGVEERVIGLTIVAFGTSLPELAAALAAGRKGEGDLVLGNIVGSNIFNLLCILGLAALVAPIPVAQQIMRVDYWVMFGTSLMLLVVLAVRGRLGGATGGTLLVLYVAYSTYLFSTPVPAVTP
ncbi:MAG: calcium/sodium antiporter [Acidobacteriota bacterium]